jgi:hypothetical protein
MPSKQSKYNFPKANIPGLDIIHKKYNFLPHKAQNKLKCNKITPINLDTTSVIEEDLVWIILRVL